MIPDFLAVSFNFFPVCDINLIRSLEISQAWKYQEFRAWTQKDKDGIPGINENSSCLTLLKIALFWVAYLHFLLFYFWFLLQNMVYSGNLHFRKCCPNCFLPFNGISMNLFHICVSCNEKKHQYWLPACLSSDSENQIRIGSQGRGHNKTEGEKKEQVFRLLWQTASEVSWFHRSACRWQWQY